MIPGLSEAIVTILRNILCVIFGGEESMSLDLWVLWNFNGLKVQVDIRDVMGYYYQSVYHHRHDRI